MRKLIESVCPRDCYDTCFLKAEAEEGRVIRVIPDDANLLTSRFLCPRGNKDVERIYSDNRILTPHIRYSKPGGALEEISWEDALEIISSKIREVLDEYGPEAILRLDYSGNMGLLSNVFSRRLWKYLGAAETDYTVCSASGHAALRLHYGDSYGVFPEDTLGMKLMVFWGFNASVSAMHIWHLAIKNRKRGGTIVSIDPIRTVTAEKSDVFLRPRPGSDVTLAYGVMKALIEKDYIDEEFIESYTYGFDKLKKKLDTLSHGYIETVTGIEWERIEGLARLYGERKPSTTFIGFGVQKSRYGAEAVRAISLIPALIGIHRGFYYSNSGAWIYDSEYLSGAKFVSKKPKVVNQVSLGRLLEKGEFKLVYIYNTNPAQTLPNSHAVRRGLSRDDVFVILHDTHWNETADYSDMILPAATYLEKEDIVFSYSHRYTRLSRRAIQPLGESRDEVWVMQMIARYLGIQGWVLEDPWHALENALRDSFEGCTFEDIMNGKICKIKVKKRDHYPTPTGKIELYSLKAEEMGISPLPTQYPLKGDGYTLITSSIPRYTHTQFQDVYGGIPKKILINPSDANEHGIETGDLVRIYNDRGEIVLKAIVSDRVSKGVLWAPKLCNDIFGRPINSITSDTPQEIGSGSSFNSTIVKIEGYKDVTNKTH